MPRKPKREGYVDAKGLHVGYVRFPADENGVVVRRKVKHKDYDEMLRRKRALEAERDAGLPPVSRVQTVREWCEHWHANIAPQTAKRATLNTYGDALRNWVYPYVGNVALVKLNHRHYDAMMRALEAQGLSSDSRKKARATLNRALVCAVQRHELTRNIVAEMDGVPTVPKVKDALTKPQVTVVLDWCRNENDKYEALAVLVLLIGPRQASALDLRWDDIDFGENIIRIEDEKSPSGTRDVPMPQRLRDALLRHQQVQELERMVADVWGDPGLVFTTSIGTRIHRRNALRWWHGVTEKAGVGRRRMHAGRHTAATVMKDDGVDTAVIAKILGHSRTAVTEAFYIKPSTAQLQPGIDAIDRIYGDD